MPSITPQERILDRIAAELRATAHQTGRARLAPRVVAALRAVPRDAFVPTAQRAHAFEDRPLEIGHGQTISQPFIVALMTDLLDLGPSDHVLEVGTGSGYQAAVLAELTPNVCSIETVPTLARRAAAVLRKTGYADRVALRTGDGSQGWPERAPFDAIVVTAVAPTVPPALLTQLRPGGRMVIPVGTPDGSQELLRIDKDAEGVPHTRRILPVAFVPLVSGTGSAAPGCD